MQLSEVALELTKTLNDNRFLFACETLTRAELYPRGISGSDYEMQHLCIANDPLLFVLRGH